MALHDRFLTPTRALLIGLVLVAGCKSPQPVNELRADESAAAQSQVNGSFPNWVYDAGPDPNSEMGKELIDLNAEIPSFPEISKQVYGDQMFRPAFGPIPWRMMQKPNSVKILFIGQDGTHIAEAAGRPATAGFGGRAQDLAKHFGVSSSAAFINTYAFTIRWQYGAADAPILNKGGSAPALNFGSVTGNPVWLISQDQDSPVVKWRNELIDWIIRNNKDSLKMIVLFGGAARDAAGAYIVSKGGTIGTRYTASDLSKMVVPEHDLVGAGSNKQTAVAFSKTGTDLYKEMAGANDYTDPVKLKSFQGKVRSTFNQNPAQWADKMVTMGGGLNGSGVIDPAQLGGYNIDEKMQINGETTISLKGLRISDDLTIDHDILVTQLPHPTFLSMKEQEQPGSASAAVMEDLKGVEKFRDTGWEIEADPGFTSNFAAGKPYKYGRAGMGTEYYDFGAPDSRMVDVSSASRMPRFSNVIIFGTRKPARFDEMTVKKMTDAKPSKMPSSEEMWIAKPRSRSLRAVFDPGPGEKYAKLMKTTLPKSAAFLAAHDINGDFGHYRGTFKNPKVVIVADPDGEDDLITARALTGSRGQYLHGLMEDLGVGDDYLVFKTAPYSMIDSESSEWKSDFEATNEYREAVLTELMGDVTPKLIIADGKWAAAEVARILPNTTVPVVTIKRGATKDAGIADAAAAIKAKDINGFNPPSGTPRMVDLPRSHLPYYARIWEGTSGDRVITSSEAQYRGKAFAVVAPRWATSQVFQMSASDQAGVKALLNKLDQGKLRRGMEKIPAYINRVSAGGSFNPASTAAPAADNATEGSSGVDEVPL